MSRDADRPLSGYTGTERILAFSDGVFAIAITLLVLNLLPSIDHTSSLVNELQVRWPSYVSYVLSFLVIGIIWTNHHQMFTQIKRSNHVFLLINVLFLMWVAALPFPAALLAQYLGSHNPDERRGVVVLYAAAFVVGSCLFNLLWWYGIYNRRLIGDQHDRDTVQRTTWSYFVGPIGYLLDLALAIVSPEAGLALFFGLAIFYALAPLPGAARIATRRRAAG